ncbi:2-dehydro-3-deoxy-D-gluconate 5-dehydrogenase KduD [Telmatospirillum sp.]|uniref:2-dehydro-3-deoxy-D-gluconate 5-dehydrogenase KduD n=1 Tax=Telmatospirillum sp. TaxID=2079197 RepID=UPI002845094B|nr:2-dehydro-3-deoxy-D-gluconate 5-dehydrogenase KduD [Telmatospirillum sp.]MDR3439140.1 2-dehydro-3-deoxy-D-gluconate 5-dehydrogenase KduD [Telmatospirillum sp.]
MSNPFDLTNKVALVTGCDTGLGQGMALALAQAGCAISGVNVVEPADTVARMKAGGFRFLDIRANLATNEAIPDIIERTVAHYGRIDILVNNAGIIRRADALDFSERDWDDVLGVNLKTVFFLSQAVARQFLVQGGGGRIVNVASMLSFQGGIRVPSYTASKSGVAGLTRLMANEWAKHGITVNAVAPGYMATNNTAPLLADAERSKAILDRIPAGRWGTPEDVGGPVVFLCSPAATYVTGHILAVDGGWLTR